MQEEVTRGAVTLIVDGAKLSEQVFEKAVKKFLEEIRKSKKPKIYRSRQSLKQLASQNAGLANIEISDKHIKACARCHLSSKLLSVGDSFTAALSSPWLSFHPTDLLIGIAGAVILRMAVYLKGKNAKKYRHGIEYGSARWGTAADITPYMDKDFFQNIPTMQTEWLMMSNRPKNPANARNKNVLVVGGSGSGKTRFFCKPSLLQAHSSYVCTDPKGTLLPLERKKYCIKRLNLINFRKSMKYNSLAYIRSEKDILKLVNALILNTKGEGEKSSEDFGVSATRSLAVRSQRRNNKIPLFG